MVNTDTKCQDADGINKLMCFQMQSNPLFPKESFEAVTVFYKGMLDRNSQMKYGHL